MIKRLAWTVWAVLPVAGLAYHFGPGQRAYTEDRARRIVAAASELEATAETAQTVAYQAHLEALKARQALARDPSVENSKILKETAAKEDAAYKSASAAWKTTADRLQEAEQMLTGCGSTKAGPVHVAKSRALIRSGAIVEGVGELEGLLDTLSESGQEESPIAREAREELATGYYYGARLMRAAGKPANEWREVSGWARQNFRYLAETSSGDQAQALQKNLELVLNLEQTPQEELLAKPLPKNSPRGNGEGLGTRPGKGKSKRPPRKGQDARGASGVGDIDAGW